MDDGDQFFHRPADLLTQGDQFLPLVRPGMNLPLDPRPEDLVFRLQEFDVPSQFPIRGRGNQGQQGVENPLHRRMFVTCYPPAV